MDQTLQQLTRLLRTGCACAASALANLTGATAEIELAPVACFSLASLAERLMADGAAICVVVPCSGAFAGWAVFGLSLDAAGRLIQQLDHSAVPPVTDRSRELLCEVGTMVVSACLGEISTALNASVAATGAHCRLAAPDQPLVLAPSNAVDMEAFTAPAKMKLATCVVNAHLAFVAWRYAFTQLLARQDSDEALA